MGDMNVCPWSTLEVAGRCEWRAERHLRPSHLNPRDFWTAWERTMGQTRPSASRPRPWSRAPCSAGG